MDKRDHDISAADPATAPEGGHFSERFQIFVEAAPLLIGYVDDQHHYRFNNQAYADWFGVPCAELYGRHIAEVVGSTAYEALRQYIETALSGEKVTYQALLPYQDGRQRYVHTTLVPDRDDAGRVRGVILFVSDNSSLQQAQDDLLTAFKRVVLVNEIGRTARSTSDPQSILRNTVQALGQALDADRCYYVTYDREHDHGILGPDWHREGLTSIAGEYKMSEYSPNRNAAYLFGQTDVVEDAFALADNSLAVKIGLRSLVRVLLQMGETMTALVAAMVPQTRHWTPDEIALVETVAAQTRAAVEGARTLQRERTFLRDVLASVTEGKLLLANGPAQLPQPLAPIGIPLTAAGGLRTLRQRVQEAGHRAGHSAERQYDLVTAVSEAGMNAVVHAGGGTAWVSLGAHGTVQARVEDHGTGIAMETLPRATLSRGFSTEATLGHRLKMMLETADRVFLLTGRGGTTVVIEQEPTPPLPAWLTE